MIKFQVSLPKNNIFQADDLNLWPMTLPIKFDLDMVQPHVHVKSLVRTSNGSAVKVHTDTHTDTQTGPILLPRPLTWEVKNHTCMVTVQARRYLVVTLVSISEY